jgi:hypothetical protein
MKRSGYRFGCGWNISLRLIEIENRQLAIENYLPV